MEFKHNEYGTDHPRVSLEYMPWEPWWLMPWVVVVRSYDNDAYQTSFRTKFFAKRHVKRVIRYANR